MTFLSSYKTKGYLLPHLTLKLKKGVWVSDSNVKLMLSVATCVWMSPLRAPWQSLGWSSEIFNFKLFGPLKDASWEHYIIR